LGFRPKQTQYVILMVFVLAIPISIDEVGKRNFFAGMLIGLALLVLAIYTYLSMQRGRDESGAKGSK
jgi:hypothetical protein